MKTNPVGDTRIVNSGVVQEEDYVMGIYDRAYHKARRTEIGRKLNLFREVRRKKEEK